MNMQWELLCSGLFRSALPLTTASTTITLQVEAIVANSGVEQGLVKVYAQGATAGIMILFNMMAPLF
jgi:thiamine phosphate synthase YjbQ (UPF0047 family)